MTKSAIVQARMEPKLKKEADGILSALGLNATTAITLFYTQLVRQRGIPLELKVPNKATRSSMNQLRDPAYRRKAKRYATTDALFAELES